MKKKIESEIIVCSYTVMLLLFSIVTAIGQTGLEGKVVASIRDEVIMFGTVALYKDGILITGTETDLNGDYIFNSLDPGVYGVEASCIGYSATRVIDVVIKEGHIGQLDIVIRKGVLICDGFIIPYKVPFIDFLNTSNGQTFTSENIRMMAK